MMQRQFGAPLRFCNIRCGYQARRDRPAIQNLSLTQ